MKVSFTGSRHGMSERQLKEVRVVLTETMPWELHHGDCVGADAQVHQIALSLEIPVVVHPPTDQRWRAFCEGYSGIYPQREYLERDRKLVEVASLLIAAPLADTPQPRSGTWYTVNYAKMRRVNTLLLMR